MAKQIFVSKEGYQKLENELEHLKTVKRKEVAMAIQKARSFGDLSENSEYDEAEIESRIAMLEVTLENATVLDDKDIKTDKVSVGNTVKIYNIATEQEEEYRSKADDQGKCFQLTSEPPVPKHSGSYTAGNRCRRYSPVRHGCRIR